MLIGQIAAKAGVNIQTLRYYERRGLLPRVRRSASGYRKTIGTKEDCVIIAAIDDGAAGCCTSNA